MCAGLGLGPGDEVIVPSLTFVATANAVAYTGAAPVFADVEGLDRPALSPAAVEPLISPATKAILHMTYGGFAGDASGLRRLADERGIALLEDAAHGLGGSIGGVALGRLGLAGAYSFFSNKNLAIGEGGALVTDDEALAGRARLLRSHGMTTLSWDRHRGHAAGYDVVALGFNHRIDEPRAALARARLRRLDDENAQRARVAARYHELLAGVDGAAPALHAAPDEVPAHHLFTVVLPEGTDRDGVRERLATTGVQTSLHYPPVHRFAIYGDARQGPLPVTDAYAARAMTLPLFPHITAEQQELVVEALADALA
jgi:dTDP-4-amino-4,6-dideoxygalactose transaminase